MPSPVSARRIGEWMLRVLSVALLAVLLMRAWAPTRNTHAERATQTSTLRSLERWSMTSPASVHLSLDSVLPPAERAWVGAIARAGTIVTWDAPHIVATAATIDRVVDPAGASELRASVPPAAVVRLRGGIGVAESIAAGEDGIRVQIPGDATGMDVSVGSTTARAAAPDSIIFKRLLVEGSASWETKFTIEALSERGWKVDAITHVAPGVDVREGDPMLPDTSRYAAVIAIDSTASLISRGVRSFIAEGGGLVTLRDAGRIGPRGTSPITLERRSDGDVRATRIGNGRVIRVGYKDLWRMRMSDADTVADPVAAHRAWLARAVAAVAYAPHIAGNPDSAADPAPLADMVDGLGARTVDIDADSPLRSEVPSPVLFGTLILSLVLELASRRFRGAR